MKSALAIKATPISKTETASALGARLAENVSLGKLGKVIKKYSDRKFAGEDSSYLLARMIESLTGLGPKSLDSIAGFHPDDFLAALGDNYFIRALKSDSGNYGIDLSLDQLHQKICTPIGLNDSQTQQMAWRLAHEKQIEFTADWKIRLV